MLAFPFYCLTPILYKNSPIGSFYGLDMFLLLDNRDGVKNFINTEHANNIVIKKEDKFKKLLCLRG
jgi:hypothetical protein